MLKGNELFAAAKEHMIGGREPESLHDWTEILIFFTHNIPKDVREIWVPILAKVFQCPIPEEKVIEVIRFVEHAEKMEALIKGMKNNYKNN